MTNSNPQPDNLSGKARDGVDPVHLDSYLNKRRDAVTFTPRNAAHTQLINEWISIDADHVIDLKEVA